MGLFRFRKFFGRSAIYVPLHYHAFNEEDNKLIVWTRNSLRGGNAHRTETGGIVFNNAPEILWKTTENPIMFPKRVSHFVNVKRV